MAKKKKNQQEQETNRPANSVEYSEEFADYDDVEASARAEAATRRAKKRRQEN